ncbi:Spherulation-specific family 4 [Penicillium odoratum]|uniref:Spherulation-specific family 4 n=1 Tax=Penicillium odoratum TaxID=1167516 RepID=UPI002547CDC4|nr:Spherulation-specific family 4 [Penicillium odoratum]KAJ5759422.1 Spherulation-specific family 4 [Penicillium odoratum]
MASVVFSGACLRDVSVTEVSVSDVIVDVLPFGHAHGHPRHGHSHRPSPVLTPSSVPSPEVSTVSLEVSSGLTSTSTTFVTVYETSFATVYSSFTTVVSSTPTAAPTFSTEFSTFSTVVSSTPTAASTFSTEISTVVSSTSTEYSTFSTVSSSPTSTTTVSPSIYTSIGSTSTSSSSTASSAASSSTASSTGSTSILLPLYIWPTDNTTWGPVYEAAAGNPDIEFQVIVNPSSGPGDTTYPEAAYIAGIAQLNSYDNVVVLGYIPTEYATRDISDVESDISTYSGWAAYTEKNIAVSGIFFDEAPRTDDTSLISYMTEVADNARSHSLNTVVFNPGTKLEEGAVNGYFDAADLIVEFENSYETWITAVPADEFSSVEDYSKDAVLLYSVPSSANYESVIAEVKKMGLGAAYLTNTDDYKSADTILKVAAAMVQASE